MRHPWIALFVVSVAAAPAAAACGSSSATSSNDADASTQDGAPGSDGSTSGEGGGSDPTMPGDPPSGGTASVTATINGTRVTFTGVAAYETINADGGQIIGFQTNAHDSKDWTFVMGVFGNALGAYSCAGKTRNAGLSVTNQIKSDGGYDPKGIEYGGTESTEACSITLTSYGPKKGDHVTGTFSAELGLSNGFDQTSVAKISLTAGTFDLVQFADTPP